MIKDMDKSTTASEVAVVIASMIEPNILTSDRIGIGGPIAALFDDHSAPGSSGPKAAKRREAENRLDQLQNSAAGKILTVLPVSQTKTHHKGVQECGRPVETMLPV